MAEPRVLVAAAEGSEELETVAVVDVLRRAGANVTLAGVGGTVLRCSRGVVLQADRAIEEVPAAEQFDCVVCPGGMPGATNLAASAALAQILRRHADADAVIAAICAAPAVVLAPLGLLDGAAATCHPAFADKLPGGCSEDRVVVSKDGKLVTSRGPGTAIEFALKLVELLCGAATEEKTRSPMLTHL
mmetsp:Transcript_17559/g.56019  ORF Transcript_17559/g.56019 Transcript_17559/m.56019 type:complete len:188 (-) Transcript_17559:823-1386(-)